MVIHAVMKLDKSGEYKIVGYTTSEEMAYKVSQLPDMVEIIDEEKGCIKSIKPLFAVEHNVPEFAEIKKIKIKPQAIPWKADECRSL